MNRNHEKELIFYQQELAKAMNEKVILQAMLDDALEQLEKNNDRKEVAE